MDLAFALKKLISAFLRPTGFVLLVWGLGFLFWWLAIRKAKRAEKEGSEAEARKSCRVPWPTRVSFVLAPILLYLFSIKPVSDRLCHVVERQVEPFQVADTAAGAFFPHSIVVLAGGERGDKVPTTSRLSYHALARVVGGVDLWKRFPDSRVVFTGTPEETGAMKAVAESLGVPSAKILEEIESRDTKDHAIYLAPVLGDSPFLLVTSATHLPRALRLFRGQGLAPTPAPVDFIVGPGGPEDFRVRDLIPKAFFCHRSETALHEIIGLTWARLRGQTD